MSWKPNVDHGKPLVAVTVAFIADVSRRLRETKRMT